MAANQGVKQLTTLEEDENRNILKQKPQQQQQILQNQEEEEEEEREDDTTERLDAYQYKEDASVSQDFALTKHGSQDRGSLSVLLDGREDDSLLLEFIIFNIELGYSFSDDDRGGASSSSPLSLDTAKSGGKALLSSSLHFPSCFNALEHMEYELDRQISYLRKSAFATTSSDDSSDSDGRYGEEENALLMWTLTTTSTSPVGVSVGSTCDWSSNSINNNASDTMILGRHSSSTLFGKDDESTGIDELQRELAVADAMHILSDIDSMIAAGGAAAFLKKAARRSLASAPIQKRPQLPLPQPPPPQQPLHPILKRFSNVQQPLPRQEDDSIYDYDDGTITTAEFSCRMDVVATEGGRNLHIIRSEDDYDHQERANESDDNDDDDDDDDSDDDDDDDDDSDDDDDDEHFCMVKDGDKDQAKKIDSWQSTLRTMWCSVA